MHNVQRMKRAVVASVFAAVSIGGAGAFAREPQPGFLLTCDNGRAYPIRARAVTVDGNLVTGSIATGRGHRVHIRLVPMGVGYRYAGLGEWVDGWRTEASLNFGRSRSVACTVTHE